MPRSRATARTTRASRPARRRLRRLHAAALALATLAVALATGAADSAAAAAPTTLAPGPIDGLVQSTGNLYWTSDGAVDEGERPGLGWAGHSSPKTQPPLSESPPSSAMTFCHHACEMTDVPDAPLGVAEAKRHFASLLDRVAAGERIVVHRRGRPAAILVPPNAEDLESRGGQRVGLAALAGVLADWDELEDVVDKIYATRRTARDRPPPDLG